VSEPSRPDKAAVDSYEYRDNPEAKRWEVSDGEDVVAYSQYLLPSERIVFTHTVVEPEYEGRGIGSRLARVVLDDAVERGLRIVPVCPFIRAYVERHPEYAEHVDLPGKRT
jgi:predicted GNAT family acetyltransferase